MSQDEVSLLRESLKELTEMVHDIKVSFAAINARQEDQIARLERSDSEQWKIIRESQARLMRYTFFATGAVSVMAFLGILDKIRALLMR
jgi:predicted metalloprotease with PDZ domain